MPPPKIWSHIQLTFLTPDEQSRYDFQWRKVDLDEDGFIDLTPTYQSFLSTFQLPTQTLAEIWRLTTTQSTQILSFPYFNLACYLLQKSLQQISLPTTLPPFISDAVKKAHETLVQITQSKNKDITEGMRRSSLQKSQEELRRYSQAESIEEKVRRESLVTQKFLQTQGNVYVGPFASQAKVQPETSETTYVSKNRRKPTTSSLEAEKPNDMQKNSPVDIKQETLREQSSSQIREGGSNVPVKGKSATNYNHNDKYIPNDADIPQTPQAQYEKIKTLHKELTELPSMLSDLGKAVPPSDPTTMKAAQLLRDRMEKMGLKMPEQPGETYARWSALIGDFKLDVTPELQNALNTPPTSENTTASTTKKVKPASWWASLDAISTVLREKKDVAPAPVLAPPVASQSRLPNASTNAEPVKASNNKVATTPLYSPEKMQMQKSAADHHSEVTKATENENSPEDIPRPPKSLITVKELTASINQRSSTRTEVSTPGVENDQRLSVALDFASGRVSPRAESKYSTEPIQSIRSTVSGSPQRRLSIQQHNDVPTSIPQAINSLVTQMPNNDPRPHNFSPQHREPNAFMAPSVSASSYQPQSSGHNVAPITPLVSQAAKPEPMFIDTSKKAKAGLQPSSLPLRQSPSSHNSSPIREVANERAFSPVAQPIANDPSPPKLSVKKISETFEKAPNRMRQSDSDEWLAAPNRVSHLQNNPLTINPNMHYSPNGSERNPFAETGSARNSPVSPQVERVPTPIIEESIPTYIIARALFDYTPQHDDELSLKAPSFVSIDTTKGFVGAWDPNGWWWATRGKTAGWCPSTFVEVWARGKEEGYSYTHPSTVFARALYPYTSDQSDDLTVQEDTIILILDRVTIKDWYIGAVEAVIGLIPGNYVEVLAEAPSFFPSMDRSGQMTATLPDEPQPETLDHHMTRQTGPKLLPKPKIPNVLLRSMNQLNETDSSPERLFTQDITQLTWLSLVNEKIVMKLSETERKRQESIFELIKTEATYVRDLQLVIEVFYSPLQNLLNGEELQKIFGNIEEILMVNSRLLSAFENLQVKSRFVIDRVGDVFVEHLDDLNCYLGYCGSQMISSKLLQRKRTENKRIGDFLKECQKNPRCRSLDLSSFLLEPMQRITRYPLLFKQIIHYTDAKHPDYATLVHIQQHTEKINKKTNEVARDVESSARLLEIARVVDFATLGHPNIDIRSKTNFLGPRKVLFDSGLVKAKSGRKINAFLFNDMLILIESKIGNYSEDLGSLPDKSQCLYRSPYMLSDIVLRDVESMGSREAAIAAGLNTDDTAFQIMRGPSDKVNVKASSVLMRKKWMKAVDDAIIALREGQKKAELKQNQLIDLMGDS